MNLESYLSSNYFIPAILRLRKGLCDDWGHRVHGRDEIWTWVFGLLWNTHPPAFLPTWGWVQNTRWELTQKEQPGGLSKDQAQREPAAHPLEGWVVRCCHLFWERGGCMSSHANCEQTNRKWNSLVWHPQPWRTSWSSPNLSFHPYPSWLAPQSALLLSWDDCTPTPAPGAY